MRKAQISFGHLHHVNSFFFSSSGWNESGYVDRFISNSDDDRWFIDCPFPRISGSWRFYKRLENRLWKWTNQFWRVSNQSPLSLSLSFFRFLSPSLSFSLSCSLYLSLLLSFFFLSLSPFLFLSLSFSLSLSLYIYIYIYIYLSLFPYLFLFLSLTLFLSVYISLSLSLSLSLSHSFSLSLPFFFFLFFIVNNIVIPSLLARTVASRFFLLVYQPWNFAGCKKKKEKKTNFWCFSPTFSSLNLAKKSSPSKGRQLFKKENLLQIFKQFHILFTFSWIISQVANLLNECLKSLNEFNKLG